MPASNANPGFGCTFAIGDGASTEAFTVMAEITSISGFGTTHRTDEVTHMTSPNGWAEHIGLGVKEGKAFTLALNFVADDAQQISLYQTRVESGSINNYRIAFTDDGASTCTFAGIISDVDINHERDSKADATITVLPTAGYTWA